MAETTEKRQQTTARDFVNVVFRRKYVILSIVVFTTVAVFYLNAAKPASYSSSSRLLVKRGQRADVFTGHVRYLTWQEEVSSQIEVILSEAVFETARRIFADSMVVAGTDEEVNFQSGSVRADVIGESNVYALTYISGEPRIAEIGCYAVTEAYRQYYRVRSAPRSLSNYFVKEIEDVSAKLEEWRTKRNEFLNEENFFGAEQESRFQMSKLSILEINLTEVRSELSSQQLQVQTLQELLSLSATEMENRLAFSSSSHRLQSSIIASLKHSLQTQRIKREELLSKYTEKHPSVIGVDNQISDLQKQLKEEVSNSYEVENANLKKLIAREVSLTSEVRHIKAAMSTIPDKDLQLGRMNSKIKELEVKHETLLSKQSESEITGASTDEWEVTLLSPPSKAQRRNAPDYLRLAVGPFLSIIIGMGLAFFFESMDHSIKNVAEAEEYLNANVLATFSETTEKS